MRLARYDRCGQMHLAKLSRLTSLPRTLAPAAAATLPVRSPLVVAPTKAFKCSTIVGRTDRVITRCGMAARSKQRLGGLPNRSLTTAAALRRRWPRHLRMLSTRIQRLLSLQQPTEV